MQLNVVGMLKLCFRIIMLIILEYIVHVYYYYLLLTHLKI